MRSKSANRAPRVVGGLLGGLLLTGSLCPRDAPPPCDPETDPDCRPPAAFIAPDSPEIGRDNIQRAFEGFTVEPNYVESLTDKKRLTEQGTPQPAFVYVPEQDLLSLFPGVFDGWEEEREVQFMLDLLETGAARPINVELEFNRFVDTGFFTDSNRRRYEVDYELTLVYSRPGEDPPEERRRYCASALWDFFGGDEGFWRLQRWEEISPTDVPDDPCEGSMGLLRATTGQGQ